MEQYKKAETNTFNIPAPSVDNLGRITYIPNTKSYKPATSELIGKQVDIITCLNNSEVLIIQSNGKKAKQLITRYYSMKSNGKSGKLLGHAPRFTLENVTPVLWESGRQEVLRKQSKTPHAWLRGVVSEILDVNDYQRHFELIEEMKGGVNVAYNPYLDATFRAVKGAKYITASNQGAQFIKANKVYCFEDGILAI
ncbi:hypothetical protein A3715_17055 [Oleiphilus sp. HI0009]|nr:hypothetical protein A3715_17055 [Oleiphilus sp. HI0009]